MTPLTTSLIAIVLVIATGWSLKTSGVLTAAHWDGVERLTYLVLFPALITHTLAVADLRNVPVFGIGGALAGAILGVALLLFAMRRLLVRLGINGPAFTSLLQGAVRWNSFVAIALAAGLHGREGATLMAIAVAAMIPLLNVICVLALARYAAGTPLGLRQTVRSVLVNPFIWSSALGLLLNQVQPVMPSLLTSYVEILGRAALGIGLLVIGAGLDLKRLARPRLPHGIAIVLKLAVMPLFAWFLAVQFGVGGVALTITIIASAVPTASGAYFLARQMGGDAPLMAEIMTLQTLLALATLPAALALLG